MRLFLPIILLAAAFGMFFLYTNTAYEKVRVLQKEESAYNDALGNSKKLQSVRDDLVKKYNTLPKESLDRLQKLLPDNVDNIRLIIEIEQLASGHGMSVTGVNYDAGDDKDEKKDQFATNQQLSGAKNNIGSYDLEFTIEGKYEQFQEFLTDLEKSLRIVDVSSITFSSLTVNEKKPSDLYTYTVKIKTYWLKN